MVGHAAQNRRPHRPQALAAWWEVKESGHEPRRETNDLARAAGFYDDLLAVIGAKRLMDMGTFIAWGTQMGSPMVALTKPFDGNAATVGNGVMVALQVDSKDKVNALHAKALALGGKDEGQIGRASCRERVYSSV